MATGDQADIHRRLLRLMPRGWFGDTHPVLDAFLQGPAWVLAQIYAMFVFARLQARITTATGGWLDMIAFDFFGRSLRRNTGQADAPFRTLILKSLLRTRGTRPSLEQVLEDFTGHAPIIIEARSPADTGAWSVRGGYNVGTLYGTDQPFTIFVTAYRPTPGGDFDGVSDADIFRIVEMVRPLGARIYMRIFDAP